MLYDKQFDLEKIAKFYKLPLVSISMKDELPMKPTEGCFIVNMQSSSAGSGTHWVAFFFFKNICYYFDSFLNLLRTRKVLICIITIS